MARASHRQKILDAGLRVMHERGFGAGLRDIARVAGVPQGCFSNHFSSKEQFGLQVLDLYAERLRETLRKTLQNDTLMPLRRIEAFFDAITESHFQDGCRNGCLIGNFALEAGEGSERLRKRANEILHELQQCISKVIENAVADGELSITTQCDDVAAFIVGAQQGAILQSRAERSPEPLERFKRYIFSKIFV